MQYFAPSRAVIYHCKICPWDCVSSIPAGWHSEWFIAKVCRYTTTAALAIEEAIPTLINKARLALQILIEVNYIY